MTSKAGYSATTAITEANQFASKAYVDASAGGSSKAYLTAVVLDTVTSTVLGIGNHLQYNSVTSSSGITLDTTTAYTTTLNVNSKGRFTVSTTATY